MFSVYLRIVLGTPLVISVCCGLFLFSPAQAQSSIKTTIKDLILNEKYPLSCIGVCITKLENDSAVVTYNADSPFIPASIQKLITAAAANELLGHEYVFNTRVYTAAPLDSGTVKGNLYIHGGGDPGFTAERMWLFVQHLYHRGIRTITGDLVLDNTFFDTTVSGPGFDEDKSSRAYEAPVNALSANFNSIAIHSRPGDSAGLPVIVDIFPEIKGLTVISTAKTLAAGKPAHIDIRTERKNGKTIVRVSGAMSLGEEPKYIYRKAWDPTDQFGQVVSAFFDQYGISLRGRVRQDTVPSSLLAGQPFYSFESEKLPVFIADMFKYSSNFTAEMLFKTLSAEKNSGRNGSWDTSAAIIKQWWRERLPGQISLSNGSGMGTANRLSASQIGALLGYVWDQKNYFPEYLASLSVSGIDGTVKSRFSHSRFKGILRAKTGTLNDYGICTLAGYALYPHATFTFVVLINNPRGEQYRSWVLQEKILDTFLP